jgi:hypothetical protein
MKYVRILGLLAVVATALTAFAATASATTLTDKTNAVAPYEGDIHAVSGGKVILNGPGEVDVSCEAGTFQGKVTNKGGKDEAETVKIQLSEMDVSECGSNDVTVTKPGEFEIHTDKKGTNDGNGTVTWNGGSISVQYTVLGFSCEYEAKPVDVGTLDGSRKTVDNKHPTAVVTTGAKIPKTGGSFFCGTETELSVDWTITTPDYLDVD